MRGRRGSRLFSCTKKGLGETLSVSIAELKPKLSMFGIEEYLFYTLLHLISSFTIAHLEYALNSCYMSSNHTSIGSGQLIAIRLRHTSLCKPYQVHNVVCKSSRLLLPVAFCNRYREYLSRNCFTIQLNYKTCFP